MGGDQRASSREVLALKLLRFAPSVEAEIEAAGDYYEDQRAGLGSEFLDAIDEGATHMIAQFGALAGKVLPNEF